METTIINKEAVDTCENITIEEFVKDNIIEINKSINQFKTDHPFTDIDIKNYLANKLINELDTNKCILIAKLKEYSYKKSKITNIANELIYYEPDLKNLYTKTFFEDLKTTYLLNDSMIDSLIETIFENTSFDDGKQKYIKSDLKKILRKTLYLTFSKGFTTNIFNAETGITTANQGDSCQFMFLSRAILAGFNCSNVDVRSSRYDAIIDFKGKLFKVQVKGINNKTISFKDRDRGGQGIDHTNEHNKGKRITSKDCDIYVAVDKQTGICYLIPMKDIDSLPNEKINSVNISNLENYKENWDIINNLYNNIN